ncbi:hypothetical protein J2X90_005700 [Variovorax paradoxus]|uniref:hypothetical protein n=1 Tax=Variovorax paradoxus TaxID=34073 RepID=UPI0027801477|nr:hypothetical protein [Variovorax paradoxus]MDQ0027864.1 hypothetical protein [Variovorax paradoxus]
MNEPRRIPITDAKTGEVRYSDPLPQQGQRKSQRIESSPASTTAPFHSHPLPGDSGSAVPSVASTALASDSAGDAGANEPRARAKTRVEIATFGQFIAHAYSMKGRKVALKDKVERSIAQDPRLSFDEMGRVGELVKEDAVLAVPRQLLLVARAVQGFPALRAALRRFVRDVLLGHPFFGQPGVEAALRNLDHAPSPADVLKLLAASDKQLLPVDIGDAMKAPEFEQLRLNAVNCMAVWLADVKSLSIPALSDALFVAVWRPRAAELEHEAARLRALTGIEELAGVGLVCEEYRRQAAEKLAQAEMAMRDAAVLRERVQRLELELAEAQEKAESQAAVNAANEIAHTAALKALTATTETEAAHLRDDVELLRTRVLRRLKADVDLLELGLEALRRPEPKVHVMIDSAERVADALRKELKNLQGGD